MFKTQENSKKGLRWSYINDNIIQRLKLMIKIKNIEFKSNPRKIWNIINKNTSCKKNKNKIKTIFNDQYQKVTNESEIVNIINSYFSTVSSRLSNKISNK